MRKVLIFLLFVHFCGGFVLSGGVGEKPQEPGTPQRTDSSNTPSDASSPAKAGGLAPSAAGLLFTLNNGAEPGTLDPHFAVTLSEQRLVLNLFEGLLSYNPETAHPVPGIADSFEVSEDGLTYTFFLRKSEWSDGTPVTARTFVQSFLRVLDPKTNSPHAWIPAAYLKGAGAFRKGNTDPGSVGVRAAEDNVLVLELETPCPYFPMLLPHPAFNPVPMHLMEKHKDDWMKPGLFVGNGPYLLKEWKPLESIKISANPKYWDISSLSLKEAAVLPGIDPDNAADWHAAMPKEAAANVAERPDYHKTLFLGAYYYLYNSKKRPFSDVRVRKALSLAVDRDALVKDVLADSAFPALTLVPSMEGYEGPEGPSVNVEEAKALLAQAGYPDGAGWPRATLLFNDAPGHREVALFLRGRWKDVLGIDVEFAERKWDTFLALKNGGDFSITRAGWLGEYPDPATFLNLLAASSLFNSGGYVNKEYDALLKKASNIDLGPERLRVLAEAEYLSVIRDAAVLPLYFYASHNRIDLSRWGGWYPNILDVHPLKYVFRK